jgi:hypothetical protein
MINLFKTLFHKFQLRIYSNRIPFLIIREFGLQQFYSPYQINEIIEKWSMNRKYAFFGYAILSSEHDYNSATRSAKTKYDYLEIRIQIADHYFNGDTSFTICDLLTKSHYRMGAITKITPLPTEWKADASYWDCIYKCKETESFKLAKY